jgi:hypothetical protein
MTYCSVIYLPVCWNGDVTVSELFCIKEFVLKPKREMKNNSEFLSKFHSYQSGKILGNDWSERLNTETVSEAPFPEKGHYLRQ